MDKYEYQVCTEQIKQLISEKRFAEAMDIADTIDWRRVRSVSMLSTVSEIYKINKRYEDARDILLLAYEKHPNGKDIVYALCELAIKLNDIVQAIECYKEFCSLAPDDPNSCILLYKIYKAQDVSLEEQIDVLEEFNGKEYIEKWAYELATLYHKTGQETKCVNACDELILWFGEGKYVRKAMELKMQHTALTPDQQSKYDGRATTGGMPKFDQPYQNMTQFGNNAQQTGPMINKYAEYIQQTGDISSTGQMYENVQSPYPQSGQMQQGMYDASQGYGQQQYGQNGMYSGYDNAGYGQYNDGSQPVTITPDYYNSGNGQIKASPEINHLGMTQNIMVQSMGTGVWNTTDLSAQLAPQVMEVLSQDPNAEIYNTPEQQVYGAQDSQQADIAVSEGEPEIKPEAGSETEQTEGQEPVNEQKDEKPEISVHTGVIDLSAADLPGQELPRMHETSDIMSKLAGVIPGTEAGDAHQAASEPVSTGKQPDNTENTDNINNTGNTDSSDNTEKTVLTEDVQSSNGGHSISTDTNERVEISAQAPKKQEPALGEQDAQVQDMQPVTAPHTDSQPVPNKPPVQKDQNTHSPVSVHDIPSPAPAAEVAVGAVSEEIANITNKALGSKTRPEAPTSTVAASNKNAAAALNKSAQAVINKNTPVEKVGDEKVQYPYDTVTDIGYVEEIPEIEQPDDIDDMLKTRELPIDQLEAYEMDSLPEVEEYEVDENEGDRPQFMRGNVRASREFDDDEYRIFCRYDGMESMKAQLVSAMDLMSMDSGHGNIAIMGPQSADCKGIAINLVKAMQSKNPDFSGKVAKISGEALNKKDIKGTLKKLENGALIVEGAGGLTKESILILTGVLSEEPENVLVIIEGLREQLKPLFSVTKQMKTVFDARIDIADFTDDDLVNYGRGYALEKEYFIDDMGGLALHNRISEMQTYDHKVTVEEVRELVDNAIRHVDKKNMAHFMDMLLGRRYDDEDNIILSEKDFEF